MAHIFGFGSVCDPVFELRFEQQTAVIKFLWDNGITGVGQRDVHGNTPLHYLVGCRSVNQELLTWWLEKPNVDTIWRECSNNYEATPEEMFYSGDRAQVIGLRKRGQPGGGLGLKGRGQRKG